MSSLVKAALGGLFGKKRSGNAADVAVPGPLFERTMRAPHPDLIRDYVRFSGGNPSAYRGQIPPLLFSQWSFPLIAEGMRALPFDLKRVLNLGCDLEVNAPLAGPQLDVSVQLVGVEDSESAIQLATRVVTGTREHNEALVAMMHAIIKKPRQGPKKPQADKVIIPLDARMIADRRFGPKAGRDFAFLTGDINPIHWLPPYAKASGFKRPILHGFAQMSWVGEAIIANVYAGDITRLRALSINFSKPFLLPGHATLYLTGEHRYAVGTAPGGTPYGHGTFASAS